MKEGLSPSQRVEFLFGQIKKHATAEQAYAALDRYDLSVSQGKRKESGLASENNVMHALYELSIVGSIYRSEQFGKEDMSGIDLTVTLVDDLIESVDVQVKSNEKDVRKFRDYAQGSKVFRPDGAEALARRGLVVLNGQATFEKIQNSFMTGLELIRSIQQQASWVA